MNEDLKVTANKWPLIGRLARVLFLLGWVIFLSVNMQLYKHLLSVIFYSCFVIVLVFWVLKLFDRSPLIIVNNRGIWSRKTIMPFSKMYLIPWQDIYFFYIRQETGNANGVVVKESLIIGRKEGKPDVTIYNCTLFRRSLKAIISEIDKYAETCQFHQLGTIQKSLFYITLSL